MKKLVGLTLAGAMLAGMVGEASAATARGYYSKGHRGAHYGTRYRHRSYGGNPAVGAAVAGAALGVIGLAAGAAAANRYDDGYGYGYAPSYGYAPAYGYGYQPY